MGKKNIGLGATEHIICKDLRAMLHRKHRPYTIQQENGSAQHPQRSDPSGRAGLKRLERQGSHER